MINNNYILQLLLYYPRVYSGLDHLMVEATRVAKEMGYTTVCVFVDSMEYVPQLQQDIETAGGIVELVHSTKIGMIQDLWQLYRKYNPIVVDTHFINQIKVFTAICSLLFGAKHYTHMHSLLGDNLVEYVRKKGYIKRFLLGLFYWVLTFLSKRVLCISEAIYREYQSWSYGSCRNVQTMYIGTQLTPPKYTKEETRELLCLPNDKIIITNISAIEYIKGIDLIISAVSKLKQKGLDILFVHIGGLRGNTIEQQQYADLLKQMVIDFGIGNNVVWLGRRSDILDVLPLADMYVHPSRSEGLGSVLLEASVAGLPLIGSEVGGIPEIVHDGLNGLLVNPGDANQLADAIEKVLRTKHRFGEQARQMVYQNFDQTKQAEKLIQMYQRTSVK